MKRLSVIIFLFSICSLFAQEELITAKRKIRINDGIGRGLNKIEAKNNAISNAKMKALERVATSFIHSYEKAENMVLTEDKILQDIHARVVKHRLIKVEYPFENVAIVTVDFWLEFLDIDFFAVELRKSAESAMVRSFVISGWGQFYNRNYLHGILFFVTTYGSIIQAILQENLKRDLKNQYLLATSSEAATFLYSKYRNAVFSQTAWLSIGITSWAFSIWEAFEDYERAGQLLDQTHETFFPEFRYTRQKSFVQKFMEKVAPKW